MTIFEQFWARIKRANEWARQSDTTMVRMSVAQFRRLVSRAHDDGFSCGVKFAKDHQKNSNPLKGLFSDVFGDK